VVRQGLNDAATGIACGTDDEKRGSHDLIG